MEDRYMTLAEATASALGRNGAGVMDSPSRLLAYLADTMDPECDEMLVLVHLCNASLVEPYRDALVGSFGLDMAEARARDYLESECRIEPGTAAAIAAGLSAGIARFQGIAPQNQTRSIAHAPSQTEQWSYVTQAKRDRTLGITPGSIRGRDIHVDLDISETEAREGALVGVVYDLPSTDDETMCDVAIPMGVGSGELLVIPNMGDLGIDGGERGDLIVHLRVVPNQESNSEEDIDDESSNLIRWAAMAVVRGARDLADMLALRPEGGDSADLVSVSAGGDHTVGLCADGTMLVAGLNDFGQCDADGWDNLFTVSAGDSHTVGLFYDGGADAVGLNDCGQCDVNDWDDLVAISAGGDHTVGLRYDGTAMAVGLNDNGQCDVADW